MATSKSGDWLLDCICTIMGKTYGVTMVTEGPFLKERSPLGKAAVQQLAQGSYMNPTFGSSGEFLRFLNKVLNLTSYYVCLFAAVQSSMGAVTQTLARNIEMLHHKSNGG